MSLTSLLKAKANPTPSYFEKNFPDRKKFGRVVKWRPELIPLGLAFFRESGQTRCNNRRAAL